MTLATLLASCNARAGGGEDSAPVRVREQQSVSATLTRAERVAQLMIVGLPGVVLDAGSERMLRTLRPGGICLYRRNIASAQQLQALIRGIRQAFVRGPMPLIAVDEEGGVVSRFDFDGFKLPGAMALGATGSAPLAQRAGLHVGHRLAALGIDMNFAPVLEVASNPRSRTIGVRAFSDHAGLASALGAAFVDGQHRAGLLSVAKHFPGHGREQVDSHSAAPTIAATTWSELDVEVEPFKRVIAGGRLDGIMMGHALAPALTENAAPVTVSATIVTDYLKTRLGFSGVVITDALSMGAIARSVPPPVAASKAIAAGADMVLVPSLGPELVHQYLMRAVGTGEISDTRLNAALERIFALRTRPRAPTPEEPDDEVAADIARAAITVLQNRGGVLPLQRSQRIAVLTTSTSFFGSAQDLHPHSSTLLPSLEPSAERPGTWLASAVSDAVAAVGTADIVVVALINDEELPVLRAVLALKKPVVLISLGRPWLLDLGRDADALVAAYSFQPASTDAVVAALAGAFLPRGRLPVTLPHFDRGAGLAAWHEGHEGAPQGSKPGPSVSLLSEADR